MTSCCKRPRLSLTALDNRFETLRPLMVTAQEALASIGPCELKVIGT
jgi:hypothetical protein